MERAKKKGQCHTVTQRATFTTTFIASYLIPPSSQISTLSTLSVYGVSVEHWKLQLLFEAQTHPWDQADQWSQFRRLLAYA